MGIINCKKPRLSDEAIRNDDLSNETSNCCRCLSNVSITFKKPELFNNIKDYYNKRKNKKRNIANEIVDDIKHTDFDNNIINNELTSSRCEELELDVYNNDDMPNPDLQNIIKNHLDKLRIKNSLYHSDTDSVNTIDSTFSEIDAENTIKSVIKIEVNNKEDNNEREVSKISSPSKIVEADFKENDKLEDKEKSMTNSHMDIIDENDNNVIDSKKENKTIETRYKVIHDNLCVIRSLNLGDKLCVSYGGILSVDKSIVPSLTRKLSGNNKMNTSDRIDETIKIAKQLRSSVTEIDKLFDSKLSEGLNNFAETYKNDKDIGKKIKKIAKSF